MRILDQQHKSYWNLKRNAIHNFNGVKVRLIRVVDTPDGSTWRVTDLRDGRPFNIAPACLDLLDMTASKEVR